MAIQLLAMPCRPINNYQRVSPLRNQIRDSFDMQLHGLGVDTGQNETNSLFPSSANCSKNISVLELLLSNGPWAGSFFCPYTGGAALLTNPRLVLKPYINIGRINILGQSL